MVPLELVFHFDQMPEPYLQDKLDRLEASLRPIGLYVDVSRVVSDGERTMVVVDALIGDVAYSARVQDPEQAQMDTSFRQIVAGDRVRAADDIREDLRRRLGKEHS